jgi:PAS domain S-box-containing protein
MGIKIKEPEIIKELRKREKQGKLDNRKDVTFTEINNSDYLFDVKNSEVISDYVKEGIDDKKFDYFTDEKYLYEKLIEISPDGIVTVDLKGVIKTCNKSAVGMLGYKTKNDLLGKHFTRIGVFKLKDLSKILKLFHSVLKGKVTKPINLEFKRLDGSVFTAEIFVTLIKRNGKTIGLQAVTRDITDKLDYINKIKESEENFRNIFELAPDGILTVNLKGEMLSCNNAFLKMTGNKKEEIIGKHFSKIPTVQMKNVPKYLSWFKSALKGKISPIFEVEWQDKNGINHYGEIRISLIKSKGKLKSIMLILRDLTDHRRTQEALMESEECFHTLFNDMVDGVTIVDGKGKILEVTNKVLDITGFKREELIGKNFFSVPIFNAKTKLKLLKNIGLRLAGFSLPPYEVMVYKKDGTPVPFEIKAEKVHYKGKTVDMASFRDISERKKAMDEIKKINESLKNAKEELKKTNMDLDKKVKERTEQIEHLLKQKDEFIGQLGHDLKNPLNPLINLIPVLEKETTNKKHKEILGVMERNANYMRNLVIKTIELAFLNSPYTKFSLKKQNLLELTTKVIEKNTILFNDKKISVKNNISKDINVNVDQLRFEELLDNILNNSIKYNSNFGLISLDAIQNDDLVTVSITDTGMGLSKDQIKKVFTEFYKADESRHDFDSSGLGMPICNSIIEKHGGKIWVESPGLGKGSTVYFTIPSAF